MTNVISEYVPVLARATGGMEALCTRIIPAGAQRFAVSGQRFADCVLRFDVKV